MNKKYLDENIFYIEDFISKEDISLFLNEVKNNSNVEDFKHHAHLTVNIKHESEAQKVWFTYVDKIKSIFDVDGEYFDKSHEYLSLIKYREKNIGGLANKYAMEPHSDDYTKEKNINSDFFVSRGIVIFLTDNFEGGEIVYVNKGITFKPKSGTLLCHPGSLEYSHAVNKFFGNDRIIFSGFIHKKK